MEKINKDSIINLSNTGVISRQLLTLENSESKRVTITEVDPYYFKEDGFLDSYTKQGVLKEYRFVGNRWS